MKKKVKIKLDNTKKKSYKGKHRFFLTISACFVAIGIFLFCLLTSFIDKSELFYSPFEVENDDYLSSYNFSQSLNTAYSKLMSYGSLILRQRYINNNIETGVVSSPDDSSDEYYNSFKVIDDSSLLKHQNLTAADDFKQRMLDDELKENFDYYISYGDKVLTNINQKNIKSVYDINTSNYKNAYFTLDGDDAVFYNPSNQYNAYVNLRTNESYYHEPTDTYIFIHSNDDTPNIFSFSDDFKQSSVMSDFWNLYYNDYGSDISCTYKIPRNEFNQRVIQRYWKQRLPSKVNDQNGNCVGYYVDGDTSLLYQVIVDNNVYYIAFDNISNVYDYYIDNNMSLPRFTVECSENSSYINVTFNDEECWEFENMLKDCSINYSVETNVVSENNEGFYMLDESKMQLFLAPNPEKLESMQAAYTKESRKLTGILYSSIASLFLAGILFIVSSVFAVIEGRVNGTRKKSVPIDINLLAIAAAIFCLMLFAYLISEIFQRITALCGIIFSFGCVFIFIFGAFNFNCILQKMGAGQFLNKLLIVIFLRKIRKGHIKYKENQDPKTFSYKFKTAMQKIKSKILGLAELLYINLINISVLFMAFFALAIFAYIIDDYYVMDGYEFTVVMIFEIIFITVIFVLIRLKKLLAKIEDVCLARESRIKEPKRFNIFKKQYEQLNDINKTIEKNIENQMQAERMKIELVTNVSHDLKTPLTSIIGYINLLSMEEDLSPRCRDYVSILEKKSDKLNQIVKDVFDISKAVSGIEVEKEEIDLCVLLRQVLGDMSGKMEESGKAFCIDIGMKKANIMGDGIKIYRVIQNLMDNAIKYSLDGTRIHLRMYQKEEYAVVEIKNVASYKMEFTPEEIVERFARGDRARTTDGNGLGLSIAKSFTEANDGNFVIETDGDLFKARAEFPLKLETPPDSEQE